MPAALAINIAQPPTPVPVNGRGMLVYEIMLWNTSRDSAELEALDVLDAASGARMASFSASDLGGRLWHPNGAVTSTIAAGEQVTIYVEFATSVRAPAGLRHRFTYQTTGADGTRSNDTLDAVVAIKHVALPVLSPPLRGGPWVAVYDPALTRGHRRVYYVEGGVARLPGRFAIDWMWPIGATAGDDGAGQDVLAVADGTIAAVRDGVAEPAPGTSRAPVSSNAAAGNFIALAIGGQIAFYEHLQPGLSVASGDRVRRGQVLGRVGATGQTAGPHLHFHLADANSTLGAEGQPYRLANTTVIGRYPSISAFGAGGKWAAPDARDAATAAGYPAPNSVVRFSAKTAEIRLR